jgi:ureidoglycolate hydrolase
MKKLSQKGYGMIPESMLEVRTYTGQGYMPLVYFHSWRVALMNFKEDFRPERITSLERHPETDEVFVLLRGQVLLILAEGNEDIQSLRFQVMEEGILYNVKPTCWHAVVMSREASILIVENADTSDANSQYTILIPGLCREIQETARREQPGCWD